MHITRLAKAAIFGFGYYLLLNIYLYLALASNDAHKGLLANKAIAALIYGSGFIITLPFVYFFYEITSLASISLILNAIFWALVFYAILLILERRRMGNPGKAQKKLN
jgi:hypothetical protein